MTHDYNMVIEWAEWVYANEIAYENKMIKQIRITSVVFHEAILIKSGNYHNMITLIYINIIYCVLNFKTQYKGVK